MNGKLSRRFIMQAIETMCSIGIHDFEKQAPQRILVDLEVLLDPETEPRADHIDDALNYDQIRDAVVQIAKSRHFDLQETLARNIFDHLSEMHSVVGLSVKTSKPDVYKDVGCASYQLSNMN